GLGYSGTLQYSQLGVECKAWHTAKPFLYQQIWANQHPDVIDVIPLEFNNYCRNPDDDMNGPWCFTDIKTMRMEYCNVPLCGE
ncbi:hypothetical protein CAPTEDRAFT_49356, partial [Capitella teleta]